MKDKTTTTLKSNAICLAANDAYATGCLATLASALAVSNLDDFSIYIGHAKDEPIEQLWSEVIRLCKQYHFPIEHCHRLPVDLGLFTDLEPFTNGTYHTYIRFYAAAQVEESRFLYLDCDMLILEDLSDLVAQLTPEKPLAAVWDHVIMTHKGDGYRIDDLVNTDNSPYFNAGLFLLNTEQYRQLNVLEQLTEIQTRLSGLNYADQTYLNYIFKDNWQPLPAAWNRLTHSTIQTKLFDKTWQVNLLHYVGEQKPWNYAILSGPNILWHSVAEATGVEVDAAVLKKLKAEAQLISKLRRIGWLRWQGFYYTFLKKNPRKAHRAKYRQALHKDLPFIRNYLQSHGYPPIAPHFDKI